MNVLSIWGGRHLEEGEIESLLRDARIARFCCLNRDGTIHATPVWYIYEDGEIVLLTPGRSRKARNVERDDRVTILVDEEKPRGRGVMVYGRAELGRGDAMAVATRIAEKYMPRERVEEFAAGAVERGVDLIVRVTPERMSSFQF